MHRIIGAGWSPRLTLRPETAVLAKFEVWNSRISSHVTTSMDMYEWARS